MLHVDDRRSYRRSLKVALDRECGVAVVEAGDFFHAVQALESMPEIVAVVADWELEAGPDGEALLEYVGRTWPRKGRLMLSGYCNADMVARAVRAGYEALHKAEPWESIIEAVCRLARPV